MNKNIDLIGDVHGDLERLIKLLETLGYRKKESDVAYHHPEGRKVIFIGDLIDRGPCSRGVLHLARDMNKSGEAQVVMGNHELNAVFYHTHDENGGYLRPHTPQKKKQHAMTLDEFKDHPEEWEEFIEWMKELPLFLELDGLRVAHASWNDADIAALQRKTLLDDQFLQLSGTKGTDEYNQVERILKGLEQPLPEGLSFTDKNGIERFKTRVRWWNEPGVGTWPGISFPDGKDFPDTPAQLDQVADWMGYGPDEPLVFFGHYALLGEPVGRMKPNVACLDYGCAKGGPLVAYRWDGETEIDNGKFLAC